MILKTASTVKMHVNTCNPATTVLIHEPLNAVIHCKERPDEHVKNTIRYDTKEYINVD